MIADQNAPVGDADRPTAGAVDNRTAQMLSAPVVPLLIRLAVPNVLIMLAQASSGLIETWWVSKLGTAAFAGMALVFPAVMLMTTMSAGALGGSISSAVARALGGRRQQDADAMVLHSIVLNVAVGLAFSVLFLLWGKAIYRRLGGTGAELEAALIYSNIVFMGNVFTWTMNGLSSVIRGTGNMAYPAVVSCVGIVFLVLLSPLLIFGFGPIPPFGIAGGGMALVAFHFFGTVALTWHILANRNPVRFRWVRMEWRYFSGILRVGALSAINALQTNLVIAGTTALAASVAGITAMAGFGAAIRLEYLLIPLIFGIGAPLVALVGTNVGAGQHVRARRIAFTGAAIAFAACEIIGLAAAIFAEQWVGAFSTDPSIIDFGSAFLRIVGPVYGFFGLAVSLYFASQGAGRLFWPLVAGFSRLLISLAGGYVILKMTGSVHAFFAVLAAAIIVYGMIVFASVRAKHWPV